MHGAQLDDELCRELVAAGAEVMPVAPPVSDKNLPAGQEVHTGIAIFVPVLNFPDGHTVHHEAPVMALYVPDMQYEQAVDPAVEYIPGVAQGAARVAEQ